MENAPTDREIEILKVLWERGEASVRDVHSHLVDQTGLHFNTTQTQMRIMDDKGLVTHRRQGRTLIYRPVCTREQVSARFLHKVYDGIVGDLVLNMLSTEKLSNRQLDEIESMIAEARKQKPRSGNKGK